MCSARASHAPPLGLFRATAPNRSRQWRARGGGLVLAGGFRHPAASPMIGGPAQSPTAKRYLVWCFVIKAFGFFSIPPMRTAVMREKRSASPGAIDDVEL